jgi:competence protein ComEA
MAGQAHDWTTGAAKWAAVFLLGAISSAGVIWSLTDRSAPALLVSADPSPPSPAAESAATLSLPRPLEISPPAPVHSAPLLSAPEPAPQSQIAAPPAPPSESAPVMNKDPGPTAPPAHAPAPVARTININTAGAAELELLPGVGPVLAARIVEHRAKIGRFRTVDELNDVKGIGPKSLEKLRPHCRVQ